MLERKGVIKEGNGGVVRCWFKGLISEEKSTIVDHHRSSDSSISHVYDNGNSDLYGDNGSLLNSSNSDKNFPPLVDKHVDVVEDEGWITIPFKKLPDDWDCASDIHGLSSLDRSFVFPGEQVHILACLSAAKQDSEIITPFKVAAIINKNSVTNGAKDQNGNSSDQESSSGSQKLDFDGHADAKSMSTPSNDVSASESFLRMEDHKRQTQSLLQRFKDSHFFARIAESGEQLWSKKGSTEHLHKDSEEDDEVSGSGPSNSAIIDNGSFNAQVSGGVARNSVKCCSLNNGDIVVLLQVNIGVDFLNDPILEILQFEKHHDQISGLSSDVPIKEEQRPSVELLKWLLPVDNSHHQVNRTLSPALMNTSHKTSFSASSGSPLFSLNHFRSYSMSSLPQNVTPNASPSLSAASSKPNFDFEDWDRFMSQKSVKSPRSGSQGLLSFRGVPLEPERFSVCCGLEGIYIPGRRWRKKLEIVQPVEIHTFVADCNTNDLLCVQIKNVSPVHIPDIIVYIDAITIILEEASKGCPSLSVPVACIEAGTDHGLPNLALRRGEEHSFILKPAATVLKKPKVQGDITSQFRSRAGNKAASMRLPPTTVEVTTGGSASDKYAVLVSCRCNYSESRLFFKKPIEWRPRISREFMLSVATETSKQTLDASKKVSQLPVQVLTLQASNLTSEDLNLTILAPASFTPPPSVLSLNSAPSSPASPFVLSTTQRFSSLASLAESKSRNGTQSLSLEEQAVPVADAIPTTVLSSSHLWLHSRVPLGCVPSQSTATVKLELLPMTDGIITLDTLRIYVKERGVTYVPERSLKINATSSIATGII
ncbi:hypothetical protein KSS87_020251 [Heliosperma pusillum]|nr:hypothetical protein KSS87_020251 [Heliosperma pusillum]